METQIQQQAAHYIKLASDYFDLDIPMPKISFNQRGRAAGTAWLQRWEVRFNPVLMQDNFPDFLQQVVPHEIAHLIVFYQYKTSNYKPKPHGKEWKFVMQKVFSCPANTRHTFDISKTQGKQFTYHCGCQIHLLSIIRHNKVQKNRARYYCSMCEKPLIYTGND